MHVQLNRLPALTACFVVATCLLVSTASAKVIWKYDDGPEDLGALAGSKMHPQYGHPGFVQGEAFGVLFRPKTDQYPVEIVSVELVMAAATSVLDPTSVTMNASIEIWNDTSDASSPSSTKPVWTIGTADFFNPVTAKPGTPIQGNTVMIYEFSGAKPGDKPPVITSGNIRVVVRINSPATDLSAYWGKTDCAKLSIGGFDVGCGCQKLAALTDTATTPKTQLMHIVWPLGTCSGNKEWKFVEDLNNGLIQMKGDFRLRMGVKGTTTTPMPDAGSTDAGSTDAGSTDVGTTPDTGSAVDSGATADVGMPDLPPQDTAVAPPPKPVISVVTPPSIPSDKPSEIEIIGENFEAGAVVKVGGTKTSVTSITPNKIVTTVLPGLSVGKHAVVVENPNGQVGFKDQAIEIKAAPAPDVAVDVGADAGNIGVGELKLDLVDPRCVSSAATTQVTVFGSGFAEGITLQAGGRPLVDVTILKSTKLTAVVPAGLAAGKQPMIAELNGGTATLADAIEVNCNPPSGPVDSGCSATPTRRGASSVGMLLAAMLMLAGLVVVRRRA